VNQDKRKKTKEVQKIQKNEMKATIVQMNTTKRLETPLRKRKSKKL